MTTIDRTLIFGNTMINNSAFRNSLFVVATANSLFSLWLIFGLLDISLVDFAVGAALSVIFTVPCAVAAVRYDTPYLANGAAVFAALTGFALVVGVQAAAIIVLVPLAIGSAIVASFREYAVRYAA